MTLLHLGLCVFFFSTFSTKADLQCGVEEIQDDCPADCPSDFCPKSEMQNVSCPKPSTCPPPACKCRFNYLRAENGTCIPTTNCPPFTCNRQFEEYNPCPPVCPTDDCSQATPNGDCPYPGFLLVLECRPTCRCMKNYWRRDGVCVPYDMCPDLQCDDDNEIEDDCPADCPSDFCPKSEMQNVSCEPPSTCPPPACKCRFNYRRAENGTCIPTRNCPPFTCNRQFEEYNSCPPVCPRDDCSQATRDGDCPIRLPRVIDCRPTCRCIRNYWRRDGVCVPYDMCPGKENQRNNLELNIDLS